VNIFIDIETIPGQRPDLRDEIRASIRPPASYKKPESVSEWMRENAEAEAEKKWRDTALDGGTGEVLAIGIAIDDDPATVFMRQLGEPEWTVLTTALVFAAEACAARVLASTFVGHNVPWDLRFLFQRCVVNGIRPPLPLRQDARPGGDFLFDTMTAWAGWGNRISLHNLCGALGIPSPKQDGEDGSMVWDMVQRGEYDRIREYCRRDVEATREVWRRLTFRGAA
jgi:hypothetical protein